MILDLKDSVTETSIYNACCEKFCNTYNKAPDLENRASGRVFCKMPTTPHLFIVEYTYT